jgi:hypothetical protein
MARRLAERVASLKPSATVEMTERVRAARASGRQIIPLSSGDPNIETDARIIAAAERAMRAGDTHYGPAQGLLALREAIVGREALRSGVRYDPADIIVTPGGKFALLTALMGVVEPGDEVLVPEPGWVALWRHSRRLVDARYDRRRVAGTPCIATHESADPEFAGQPDWTRLLGGRNRPRRRFRRAARSLDRVRPGLFGPSA